LSYPNGLASYFGYVQWESAFLIDKPHENHGLEHERARERLPEIPVVGVEFHEKSRKEAIRMETHDEPVMKVFHAHDFP